MGNGEGLRVLVNGDLGDCIKTPYHIIGEERIYSKLMSFEWLFYGTLYILWIEQEIYGNRTLRGLPINVWLCSKEDEIL